MDKQKDQVLELCAASEDALYKWRDLLDKVLVKLVNVFLKCFQNL